MTLEIVIDAEPSEKSNEIIRCGVQTFNENYTGVKAGQFSVFAKLDDNIIGGAICYQDENSIYIDLLWVNEDERLSGIGTKVLALAEKEGIKRGAKFSTLDTFDFQAEESYQKNGYTRLGVIPSYLGKHDKIFLRKQLSLPSQ